jgi:hypothetical protein
MVKQSSFVIKAVCVCLVISSTIMSVGFCPAASAQELHLPAPDTLVLTSQVSPPPLLKGLIIDPEKPFNFDFVLDLGSDVGRPREYLSEDSERLIKYFLASLTMPEADLCVHLSPFEGDRITSAALDVTELGRDLLAQDYLLKQLSSSLTHPEGPLGQIFWDTVRQKAREALGTDDIPLNAFSKVWIVPDRAKIFENRDRAFIVRSHLKILTEEDYFAARKTMGYDNMPGKDAIAYKNMAEISAQVMKDIIIPEIEKEVNTGKNFALLRQIYHSYILAVWYKDNLRASLLGSKYVNQKKIDGLE